MLTKEFRTIKVNGTYLFKNLPKLISQKAELQINNNWYKINRMNKHIYRGCFLELVGLLNYYYLYKHECYIIRIKDYIDKPTIILVNERKLCL